MELSESLQAKAIFDRVAAGAGLIALSPVLLLTALAVVVDDGFPVVFRQIRIGRSGRPFQLLKFRSMRIGVPGGRITAGRDPRLTRVGRWLRRYKVDELLQLWNVVKGDMSLVGPRPEVPAFVNLEDPVWRAVLAVKPGITDLASLIYRHEEDLLAAAANPEQYYRDAILPAKLALNLQYMQARSFWLDLRLLLLTARYSLFPAGFDPTRVHKVFQVL